MNILSLLTVTLFISYLWFDVFEIGFVIKGWFKIDQHKFVKPWDCYTCTNGWIGIAIGLIWLAWQMIFSHDWTWMIWLDDLRTFVLLNFLVGHYIDHIKHIGNE